MTWDDRFWSKVQDTGDCWEWTGRRTTNGYGDFGHSSSGCRRGRSTRAHRIAYELVVGQVPRGLELDHLCRNRGCVNPAHLEPVTHAENVRRGEVGVENQRKTHCPQGHPYSGANLYINPKSKSRRCLTCKIQQQRDRRAGLR